MDEIAIVLYVPVLVLALARAVLVLAVLARVWFLFQ